MKVLQPIRLPFWRGWAPLVVLPAVVLAFTPADWPRWAFMWLLAFTLFAGCKWLTWRRTPVSGIPLWIHAGYLLAWPGLNVRAFLGEPEKRAVRRPSVREWAEAVVKIACGATLFWGLTRLIPSDRELLIGWLGMAGLILLLHFGTFHLLSCAWRALGIDARPLMNRPLLSTGVAEFWQRWNTAFRDLTYRFLFRPLTNCFGSVGALLVGFTCSGLIHDLVLSVPARGGYGWPTLYFVAQVPAILVERSRLGRRIGLGRGPAGRIFTLIVLLGPIGGLFHPPFVRNVVIPFMRAFGAA